MAVNRLLPWYGGLIGINILFFFSYYFFYAINGCFFLFLLILLGSLAALTSFYIINALLFLMFTYLLVSITFFLVGLDFLGLILIFIYVGAIAILFLFVVMTLSYKKMVNFKFLNFFDSFFLFVYLIFIFIFFAIAVRSDFGVVTFENWYLLNIEHTQLPSQVEFLTDLGYNLYGEHIILFFLITIILFLGFFCPIVLTLEEDSVHRLPKIDALLYPGNKIIGTTLTFFKMCLLGTTIVGIMLLIISFFM